MTIASLVFPDLFYLKSLIRAGLDGVNSAFNEKQGGIFMPAFKDAVWTPTAFGAAIGIASMCFGKGRRSAPRAAVGALIGSAVGLGGGAAWASRRFTGAAARRAMRGVNQVRDARWLERHPIDYA
jgi:hypothetical protein